MTRNDAEVVLAFLRKFAGLQFCSACLAFEFILSFADVQSALVAAGQQTALTESLGLCAICGQRALVTGLERRSDRSREERVLEFLGDHLGRRFCHPCIAQRLALRIRTVQKAVWELRELSMVRIEAATCSECGQLRLVIGRDDGAGA